VDVGSFPPYIYVPTPWPNHTKTTIRGAPSLGNPSCSKLYFSPPCPTRERQQQQSAMVTFVCSKKAKVQDDLFTRLPPCSPLRILSLRFSDLKAYYHLIQSSLRFAIWKAYFILYQFYLRFPVFTSLPSRFKCSYLLHFKSESTRSSCVRIVIKFSTC
jgi:hypothetical protein